MKNITKKISKEWIVCICTTCIFAVLSVVMAMHHEPWADEAQSWLLARDASLSELLFKFPHYEGSPLLWSILLKVLIAFKLPYEMLNFVPISFGILSCFLLTRPSSPLPIIVKILLPFNFFIFYQYNVIARSYSLMLPLLLLVYSAYKKRQPWRLSFLLIILSFSNSYGLISSMVILLSYLIENRKMLKCTVFPVLIFIFAITFIAFNAFPYSDTNSLRLLSLDVYDNKQPFFAMMVIPILVTSPFFLFEKTLTIPGIAMIVVSMMTIYGLAYSFKKNCRYLLPLIAFSLFIGCFYLAQHHIGIMVLLFIYGLMFLYGSGNMFLSSKKTTLLLLPFLFFGILSGGYAFAYEISNNYSGAFEAQKYVREEIDKNSNLQVFATTYYDISLNPYFPDNIFSNMDNSYSYYWWSDKAYSNVNDSIKEHMPDIVIISQIDVTNLDEIKKAKINKIVSEQISFIENMGDHYELAKTFDGNIILHTYKIESTSVNVYKKIRR